MLLFTANIYLLSAQPCKLPAWEALGAPSSKEVSAIVWLAMASSRLNIPADSYCDDTMEEGCTNSLLHASSRDHTTSDSDIARVAS